MERYWCTTLNFLPEKCSLEWWTNWGDSLSSTHLRPACLATIWRVAFLKTGCLAPFTDSQISFSRWKKGDVRLQGVVGEAALLSYIRKLTFPSLLFCSSPSSLWTLQKRIRDPTVNPQNTEGSKPSPQVERVCWEYSHSIWHLFHFKTGSYK